MRIGAGHEIIFAEEKEWYENNPDFVKFLDEKMANDLAHFMLDNGLIERTEDYRKSHDPSKAGIYIRMTVDIPDVHCGQCAYYDETTNYCSINRRYYPKTGFCSEGSQKVNNMEVK